MNQATEVTLPYEQFAAIADYEIDRCVAVTVSLGCAEFARRDLPPGAGAFPVHLSCKTPEGRWLGTGAYAGFVHGFDQAVLEQIWQAAGAVLDEDTLYQRCFDVNVGTHADTDGQPVCIDCLRAGGGVYIEGDEEEPLDSDRDYLTFHRLLRESEVGICWSCKQMIDESINSVRP